MANTGSLSNYLINLTWSAGLHPNFAQDFSDIIKNININFQRIASAPYLKGDHGDDVVNVSMPLYDYVENVGETFTTFGAMFVNFAFGTSMSSSNDYQDLVNALAIVGFAGAACSQLNPYNDHHEFINPSIDVLYEPHDNKYLFVSPFFLLDGRINELNTAADDARIYFKDYSCAIYGVNNQADDDASWVFHKYNVFPTLYYDDTANCFCWVINGTESGIIAQGIKGEDGKDAKIHFAEGTVVGATSYTYEWTPQVVAIIRDMYSQDLNTYESGDLAYVWFDNPYILGGDLDAFVGSSATVEEGTYFWNTESTSSYDANTLYVYESSSWRAATDDETAEQLYDYRSIYVPVGAMSLTLTVGYYYYMGGNLVATPFYVEHDLMIGVVEIAYNNVDRFIRYMPGYSLQNILQNTTVRQLLDSIGYESGNNDYTKGVRGLYLRDNWSPATPTVNDLIHMAFTRNEKTLIVRPEDYRNSRKGINLDTDHIVIDPMPASPTTMKLEYDQVDILNKTNIGDNHVVHMDAENGLVITKSIEDSDGVSTLLQLVGPNSSLVFKTEERDDNYIRGLRSFFPFTGADVFCEDDATTGKLRLYDPGIGYVHDDDGGPTDEQYGIDMDNNNSTNVHYSVFEFEKMPIYEEVGNDLIKRDFIECNIDVYTITPSTLRIFIIGNPYDGNYLRLYLFSKWVSFENGSVDHWRIFYTISSDNDNDLFRCISNQPYITHTTPMRMIFDLFCVTDDTSTYHLQVGKNVIIKGLDAISSSPLNLYNNWHWCWYDEDNDSSTRVVRNQSSFDTHYTFAPMYGFIQQPSFLNDVSPVTSNKQFTRFSATHNTNNGSVISNFLPFGSVPSGKEGGLIFDETVGHKQCYLTYVGKEGLYVNNIPVGSPEWSVGQIKMNWTSANLSVYTRLVTKRLYF